MLGLERTWKERHIKVCVVVSDSVSPRKKNRVGAGLTRRRSRVLKVGRGPTRNQDQGKPSAGAVVPTDNLRPHVPEHGRLEGIPDAHTISLSRSGVKGNG